MEKTGLNVGSGQRPFRSTKEIDWVNIDKVERDGQETDLVCDGTKIPFGNDTVDYVVLHHVLEHFGCGEGAGLVDEARRVLRPKGSLLVFVPDMQALAVGWMQGKISDQIYMTNVYGAYMGSEEDRHRWGFVPQTLKTFLQEQKFYPVWAFDWRPIPGADIARDWWILGMEAVK